MNTGIQTKTDERRERETTQTKVAWSVPSIDLAKFLSVNPEIGLSHNEVEERIKEYGPNQLRQEAKISALSRFFNQLKSPVVITLLIANALSLLLGEWADAIAIAVIVILNAVIGYLQEAKAEEAVEALKKLSAPKARILRDGEVKEYPGTEVVPGDILVFEAGDYISADARIIIAHQLSTNESILTGESLPVRKQEKPVAPEASVGDRSCMLFADTVIATGSARAVVTMTGMKTEIGRIAQLLTKSSATQTPLQIKLSQVSQKLLLLSLAVVALVAGLGLLRGETWFGVLMSGVSLAVAAIPEGLPTVVTLALALAVRRMVRRNAIVRHLPAVETLGSTDVICTDKTGTLTTGKMRVREVLLPGTAPIAVSVISGSEANSIANSIVRAGVLCSNATLGTDGSSSGDPTEVALLQFAQDLGFNSSDIRKKSSRLFEWSFDSDRKRMSVLVRNENLAVLYVKGAPESVLPLCNLTENQRVRIESHVSALSKKGMRLLAIAEKQNVEHATEWQSLSAPEIEKELEYLGFVAIADPPRTESIEAIRACKAAGIRVVMITGDHPATAEAIARELGIIEKPIETNGELNASALVLTGQMLEKMTDETLASRVANTSVYARVSPEHKLRIIRAWQSLGKIVAMTGDGVNDAPALKAASIGVSMGKGGTEVARQASSMILTDDNFATIVSAVEEGRAIFGNIKRTIQYLLSGNLAEILIMFGAAIAGWPAPLYPIHLLWINLVTDGLPSLALAAEPVAPGSLHSSYKPSASGFFDRHFYREMVFVGTTVAAMALFVYGYSLNHESELTARTHVFSFLVFAELFRSFASRSETKTWFQLGLRSNLYHFIAVMIPILLQFSMHHFTFYDKLFKVDPLGWRECFVILALTLVPVTIIELRKWMRQRNLGEKL